MSPEFAKMIEVTIFDFPRTLSEHEIVDEIANLDAIGVSIEGAYGEFDASPSKASESKLLGEVQRLMSLSGVPIGLASTLKDLLRSQLTASEEEFDFVIGAITEACVLGTLRKSNQFSGIIRKLHSRAGFEPSSCVLAADPEEVRKIGEKLRSDFNLPD